MGRSKRYYDLILNLWPLYKAGIWLGRQPVIGRLLKPVFSPKLHQVTVIPIGETISQGEQDVLPYSILTQLVERASTRFIMTECVCRKHEDCQSHPVELGCLFLGDGAAQIHPSLGRICDVEQAMAHIHRGMENGLYPLIAHTMIDAVTLKIPYQKMLTVCFCCECCCMVYRGLRTDAALLSQVVQRLAGVKVSVTEDCTGCGACVDKCPVGAINVSPTGATITEECKGCGICIPACPSEAILMEIEKSETLLEMFSQRINSYADIGTHKAA